METMDTGWILTHKTTILIAIVILSGILGFSLRLLPMDEMSSGPMQKFMFMDTYYSMRQIEQTTANFPEYALFDPMNGFPEGHLTSWGPLFTILCAFVCTLFGVTERPDNMILVSWIPPILAMFMIPTIYVLASKVWDKKAGFISAILVTLVAGEFMYRSFWGYMDHHVTETLFLTLAITLWICVLSNIKNSPEKYGCHTSWILAAFAGVAYYLGIMTMPTLLLFSLIIVLSLLIQFCLYKNTDDIRKIVLHLAILYAVFSILYVLTGITNDGINFYFYTITHIIVGIGVVIEGIILYFLAKITESKPLWQRFALLIVLAGIGLSAIFLISKDLWTQMTWAFHEFFLFSYTNTYISEMQMWSLTGAFKAFNIGCILMIIGFVLAFLYLKKNYSPELLTVIVFGLVLLVATVLHLRYEYYVTPVIVLFSAIALSWIFDLLSNRKRNKKQDQSSLPLTGLIVVLILMGIIIGPSISQTVNVSKQLWVVSVDDDFTDALLWLSNETPSPKLDYLKIYNKEDYTKPENSYGVLSWWDYGHWIEFISKRPAISTPFQTNVQPVARYYLAEDEETANSYADELNARYILTDYTLTSSKFNAIPVWANNANFSDFQNIYYQLSSTTTGKYQAVLTLQPEFYDTMVARLYFLDGSSEKGYGGTLIDLDTIPMNGLNIPVITKSTHLSNEQAKTLTPDLSSGQSIVSNMYTQPIYDVEALSHYRLVYESPTTIAADDNHEVKQVKIFEYVPGFTINGSGTITLPLKTNQGREFTYTTQSKNGTFTLPYSTTGSNGVIATGPYTIVETGEKIEVTEKEVLGE